MSNIAFDTLKQSILTLLTEAYAGPPDPHETWFVDNAPDSGIFGAIRGLSAAQASRSVDGSGRRGTTVASKCGTPALEPGQCQRRHARAALPARLE